MFVYCIGLSLNGLKLIINKNFWVVYCMLCTRIGFQLIIKENVRFVHTVYEYGVQ